MALFPACDATFNERTNTLNVTLDIQRLWCSKDTGVRAKVNAEKYVLVVCFVYLFSFLA